MILAGRPEVGDQEFAYNSRDISYFKGKIPLNEYVAFQEDARANPLIFEGCPGFVSHGTTPKGDTLGTILATGDSAQLIKIREPGKVARGIGRLLGRQPNVSIEGHTPTYHQAVKELFQA